MAEAAAPAAASSAAAGPSAPMEPPQTKPAAPSPAAPTPAAPAPAAPTPNRSVATSRQGGGGGGSAGGGGAGGGGERAPSAAQMTKLRDANAKYKSLLKMAKERIQAQEEELEKLRAEARRCRESLANEKVKNAELMASNEAMAMNGSNAEGGGGGSGDADGGGDPSGDSGQTTVIVRVCQRVRVEAAPDDDRDRPTRRARNGKNGRKATDDGGESDNDGGDEDGVVGNGGVYPTHVIWALVEYETFNPDALDNPSVPPPRRFQRWRKFETESDLSDHVRRDTGEPIVLPPYSLSPSQSAKVEDDARRSVAAITDEYRRFRVRSEVARKQADATVRALHSSNVQTTRRRIEGQDLETELAQARTDHAQLSALRAEMAEQEARWKEAYDTLMAENSALKSSGAEALLAAQWRQRYETCLGEKEDAEARLAMEREKAEAAADQRRKADAGRYEMKYRDLKESFRLYRKKAKEIFEAQQRGVEAGGIQAGLLSLTDHGTEEAKLAYLRNLMVNYLSSDMAVREHMEGAIGTVLKFSRDDFAKIEQMKEKNNESWFG